MKRRIIALTTAALMAFALVLAFALSAATPDAQAWALDPEPEELPDGWTPGPDGVPVPEANPDFLDDFEFGATEQRYTPHHTPPILTMEQLIGLRDVSREFTSGMGGNVTVTIDGVELEEWQQAFVISGFGPSPEFAGSRMQAMQNRLHALVSNGTLPDGSHQVVPFQINRPWIPPVDPETGEWEQYQGAMELSFSVADAAEHGVNFTEGGEYRLLYHDGEVWHLIEIRIENGMVHISIPPGSSLSAIIRVISIPPDSDWTYTAVLEALTAPATGQ